jgi:hypothetical protein
VELDRVEPGAAAEGLDRLGADDLHATTAVELDEMLGDLRRAKLGEQVDIEADQGDVEPELGQRGGDLHADETAADDDRVACRRGRLPDRGRILDRPKAEDAGQLRALDWEPARKGSRRQQQPAIAVAAPVARRDRPLPRGEARGLDSEQELDAVVVVELLRLDECVVPLGLAAQEALRQRRAVVGQRLLLRQQGDPAFASCGPVFADRPGRREAAADDHELESGH